MTAVLVPDGAQPSLLRMWDQAALETGRSDVHWQDVRQTGARKHLLTALTSMPDIQVISVVLCKWHLPNVTTLTDPAYFYHWTTRLLVERLSWFGDHTGDIVAMTFAQVGRHPPSRVRAYLRRLERTPTYIRWPNLKLPPAFNTPKNRRMLQVADTASGAVFAAFEADEWGATDQTYITMLKPLFWKRPWRPLYKDGLKVGPWPHAECATEQPWLAAFCV